MTAAVERRSQEHSIQEDNQSVHCNGVTCREAAVIRAVLGNTTNTHVGHDVQSAWWHQYQYCSSIRRIGFHYRNPEKVSMHQLKTLAVV